VITYVRWFDDLDSSDIALVGGKNASLGEMISGLRDAGVRVPDGFAITVDAYRRERVAIDAVAERINARWGPHVLVSHRNRPRADVAAALRAAEVAVVTSMARRPRFSTIRRLP
jgi:hypothetical protein